MNSYNKTIISDDYAFLCGRFDFPKAKLIEVPSYIDIHFDHKIIQELFENIIECYKNNKNILLESNSLKDKFHFYKTEPYHRDRPGILEGFPQKIINNNKDTLLKSHVKKYLYDDIYSLKTFLQNYFNPFTIEVEEQPLKSNTKYFYILIKLHLTT